MGEQIELLRLPTSLVKNHGRKKSPTQNERHHVVRVSLLLCLLVSFFVVLYMIHPHSHCLLLSCRSEEGSGFLAHAYGWVAWEFLQAKKLYDRLHQLTGGGVSRRGEREQQMVRD